MVLQGNVTLDASGKVPSELLPASAPAIDTLLDAASGTENALLVDFTVAQSGVAGYAGLKVKATETSTGSSAKRLLDLLLGSTSMLSVDNAGVLRASGSDSAIRVNGLGDGTKIAYSANVTGDSNVRFSVRGDGRHDWGPGGVSSVDVSLERSAAGVLRTNGLHVSSGTTVANHIASYTLVLSDAGTVVTQTVATANTVTVPPNSAVAFPIGTQVEVINLGAGTATITAGSGVTVNTANPGFGLAQYAVARLRKVATDTWIVSGQTA